MKRLVSAVLCCGFGIAVAASADGAPPESCEQIRAQIMSHTGIPPKPNTELLSKVGANPHCNFTSAEAYRAGWGDTPLPAEHYRPRSRRHHERDDD